MNAERREMASIPVPTLPNVSRQCRPARLLESGFLARPQMLIA